MPQPSAFVVEMAFEKLKRHMPLSSDQIPAELIKTGAITILYEIHKLINCIWNKEESPEEWMKSCIVPLYTKDDKTDYSHFRGIMLLPNTYRILSNILMSRLIPCAEEIIGNHQCEFRRKNSTVDHMSIFVK